MSESGVSLIMKRIEGASPSSPIAVFACSRHGFLDAVFAATVKTQQRISNGDSDLVGVYGGTMDLEAIRNKLRALAG